MHDTDWAKVLGELAGDEAVRTQRALDGLRETIDAQIAALTPTIPSAPEDVAVQIERALAILDAPIVQKTEPPLVININTAEAARRKTITMRKGMNGETVADVVEGDP